MSKCYLLTKTKKGSHRCDLDKVFPKYLSSEEDGLGGWVAAAKVNVLRAVKVAAHLLQGIIDLDTVLKYCHHLQEYIFIDSTPLIKAVFEQDLDSQY